MKTLILACFIAFLTLGCATQKRCFEKWQMRPDTVKIVSVRDSIVWKDTTIFIHIPGKIVIDSVFIPCPPPPPSYIPDTARAETSLAIAKAWWSYPVIALSLVQKETDFAFKLDSVIKESYHWRNEYNLITQVLKEKYVPKIYKQALFICIVIFAGFFIWLGFKIFNFFKK